MTALADNPAVLDPASNLTRAQQEALSSLDFYKTSNMWAGFLHVGNKRFSASTVNALKVKGLIARQNRRNVALTLAGKMAVARLKGART